MSAQRPLKVAIVHDWLYGGGAELVVEQLHKLYPEAPIFVSWATDEWRQRLDNKVVTGFLQHQPFRKFYKFCGPFRIWWYTHLKFKDYDLVISSSGAEAKGIKVPKGTLHINYCHAPTHYYWSRYDEYMAHPGFGALDGLARFGLRMLVAPLRKWDYKAAQRPDYLIANSSHIQREIKKYYGRDSTVIFPPVDTTRFANAPQTTRNGFLIAGRQTPYKRFDLAVQACSQLSLPLRVVGDGPDNVRLRKLAGPSVTFLGRLSGEDMVREMAGAAGFIFPGLDDFGIVPIEAMAAGTPVIAFKGGGALDYIEPGTTGEFFTEQTVDSLAEALQNFHASHYHTAKVQASVKRFSVPHFREAIQAFIAERLS